MSWKGLDGVAKAVAGTRAAHILLYLFYEGPAHFRRIVGDTGISPTLAQRHLRRLVSLGLVERRVLLNERRRWAVSYSLTEKGRAVAEALALLHSVLYPSASPTRGGGGAPRAGRG